MINEKYIRFDWAVKQMLRDKANFGVLEGLIAVVLGEKTTIETIFEKEIRDFCDLDKYLVYIEAKDEKGTISLIEIKVTTQLFYFEYLMYGPPKAITEHISLGQRYSNRNSRL